MPLRISRLSSSGSIAPSCFQSTSPFALSKTVKGVSVGAARSEYEYAIPLADAEEMLATLCARPLLEKRRTRIPAGEVTWEVDEFLGENLGLVVAEVELRDRDQPVALPAWIGAEVTGDARYYNSNLLANPFSRWVQ